MLPGTSVERNLRRIFDRKAVDFDGHAWLHREVAHRLLDHLKPVTIEPARLLDLGSATGDLSLELTRRFRSAQVYSVDFSRQMLFLARTKSPRWFSRQDFVCSDAESLGFADHSVQLVCGNLVLPWVRDTGRVLGEANRVLEAGGLLMLSSFGPQTLSELRAAFRAVDNATHVNSFMDMHDLGDAMTAAGFQDVVVDVERLNVSYRKFATLLQEVRAMGAGNVSPGRRHGLMGRDGRARLKRAYEAYREGERYRLTFELVFAQGWKPRLAGRPVEVKWRDQD